MTPVDDVVTVEAIMGGGGIETGLATIMPMEKLSPNTIPPSLPQADSKEPV